MNYKTREYLRYYTLLRSNPAIGCDFLRGIVAGDDEVANDFCADPSAMLAVFRNELLRAGDKELLEILDKSKYMQQAFTTYANMLGLNLTGDLETDFADLALCRKLAASGAAIPAKYSAAVWPHIGKHADRLTAFSQALDLPLETRLGMNPWMERREKKICLPSEVNESGLYYYRAVSLADNSFIAVQQSDKPYPAHIDLMSGTVEMIGGSLERGDENAVAISDDEEYVAIPCISNSKLGVCILNRSEGYKVQHIYVSTLNKEGGNYFNVAWDQEHRRFACAAICGTLLSRDSYYTAYFRTYIVAPSTGGWTVQSETAVTLGQSGAERNEVLLIPELNLACVLFDARAHKPSSYSSNVYLYTYNLQTGELLGTAGSYSYDSARLAGYILSDDRKSAYIYLKYNTGSSNICAVYRRGDDAPAGGGAFKTQSVSGSYDPVFHSCNKQQRRHLWGNKGAVFFPHSGILVDTKTGMPLNPTEISAGLLREMGNHLVSKDSAIAAWNITLTKTNSYPTYYTTEESIL